jgi:hypothetical protein
MVLSAGRIDYSLKSRKRPRRRKEIVVWERNQEEENLNELNIYNSLRGPRSTVPKEFRFGSFSSSRQSECMNWNEIDRRITLQLK